MFKIFKRFYHFLFRYKKAFVFFVIVLVAAAVLGNLGPYFYKLLIDNLPSRDYSKIIKILLLFVGARIVANLLDTLSHYLGDKVMIPAARDARITVFRYIQDLDFAFHVNKNTGSLISAFKRGDGAFFGLFHDLHYDVGGVFISLLVLLFFFSQISTSLVFLILLIFTGNLFLSWRLIKLNIRKRRAFNQAEDRISGVITDNLINYETVKFFAQEQQETRRLRNEFKDWVVKLWQYVNTFRLMDISIGTISNLGSLLIFWLVVKKLIAGESGVGDFVMVASFMTGFYWQFFRLLYHLRNIARNFADIQRYFSILDDKIEVKDPAKPLKIKNIQGKIKFEKVGFSYPDSKGILKNINLLIKPKETVAFVGRSGVGKTTLVRLLLRFYDVKKGKIMIDGTDIRKLSKSHLRSFFGVVPQEPILFNNTIGYNIIYGKNKTSFSEMVKAARMANLHDFIDALPKKYDTEVGERGIKLSSGQKQRLAIARMLLVNPKVIIFDEATSNLDSESERLIQDALWKVAKQRTVLIIAHRFSTVRRADKIVVMEKGQIVETGSHQDLIENKKGLYRYLWLLQSKGQQGEVDPDLLK
ncbi:MAG TPA: ABC transporter ATP-binding protein [Nevskiaceae bacterium]|nr:ABC transporter ATP-binding protein [Nevskiaceae bacterium]